MGEGDHVKKNKKKNRILSSTNSYVGNVLFAFGIRWFVCAPDAINRIFLGNRFHILLYISLFFYVLLLSKQVFI